MAPQPANRTVDARNAFTLVELMIVVVIIAILIALLMPVLSGAYRTAMKTADAALIHQIAMGCETYNQAFSQYPPSAWSGDSATAIANAEWNVWPPPYSRPQMTIAPWPADQRPRLVGSAKVYAYLSGFNAIGCWDPANPLVWNPAGWNPSNPSANPCGTLTGRGILVDANPADPGTSEDKVYGPYYIPDSKGETTTTIRWGNGADQTGQQKVFASRFARQRPAPVPAAGGEPEKGAPILYYRAAAAPTDRDSNGVIEASDIFAFEDNYAITDWAAAQAGVWTPFNTEPLRRNHPLYAPADGKDHTNADYVVTDPSDHTKQMRGFGITRPLPKGAPTTPSMTPYNATTFILISPGPDGEYFTEDDVTNFRQ